MRTAFAVLFLVVMFTACSKKKSPTSSCTVPTMVKGFSYSPEGFPNDFDKAPQFLVELHQLKDSGISWQGSWRDDVTNGADAGIPPAAAIAIAENIELLCIQPFYTFSWRTGTTLEIKVTSDNTNDWTNSDAIDLFETMLTVFATEYQPAYIFLGSENDFYYEMDAADYANWLAAYDRFYDAIKAVSPSTKVGPGFSYEHIAGKGTLMGWNMAQWGALDDHDFDKIDVIGVTVFPFFEKATASEMSSTYLDALWNHADDKPVVILSTGWPAEDFGDADPDWTPSEDEQVDFIGELFPLLVGQNVPAVNWLFLNSMEDDGMSSDFWKMFGSISLRRLSGTERPAYDLWKEQ